MSLTETAAVAELPGAAPQCAPRVVGLDLSLTSTGVAFGVARAEALRYKGRGHGRLAWLRAEIRQRTNGADLVVVEGAAFASGAQAGHHELAGLWWMVTHDLWRRGIPYAIVPPHSRTIYAMGRANPAQEHPREKRAKIAKGMVRDAVRRVYGLECEGAGRYDESDAAVLAAMGLDWLGWAAAGVPDTHRRALDGVAWPEQRPLIAR